MRSTCYEVRDRLHDARAVCVSADGIVATVCAWLAELGAESPLVEELARAVRERDWPAAHSVADYLSVNVIAAGEESLR
jgi:hypothetical protein